MFEGFATVDHPVKGARIHARLGGAGAPVLLLHGYPQTHALWGGLAPALAQTRSVVAADLRGYGDSRCFDGDFSFRAMARDMVQLMAALGFERFDLVAHDRGARTAHRLALDHPDALGRLVLMDILPTLDVWQTMDDWLARRYWHWAFLAQPGGLPQRMIARDPVDFLHGALTGLAGGAGMFPPEAMAEYERCAQNPDVTAAWCADYAAAAGVDLAHDRAALGRTLPHPCLVLWGARGAVAHHVNPLERWRLWFPQAQGQALEAGHYLVEECPDEVLALVTAQLAVQSGSMSERSG